MMPRRVFAKESVVALALVLAGVGTAATFLYAPAARPLAVEPGQVVGQDLGTHRGKGKARAVLRLKNSSDKPIRPVALWPSCGCTGTVALPETIPPREARDMPFDIDPQGRVGVRQVSMAVGFDDGTKATGVFQLTLEP